ncbi:MAG TPA: PEP/pyruvate-binding domain-containing protein [Alphaproteobacteria bacterium]|nr:PEP/pyruvate-binding domain-containing protein [Alphaproteobacteria bacterium]
MSDLLVPLASKDATDAARFGPKAASQARLAAAGLPIAGGFALDAAAYRRQVQSLGLEETTRRVFAADGPEARRAALEMKLGLLDKPIADEIAAPLLEVWQALMAAPGAEIAVRSSALVEDRADTSFAGQFESYLGLDNEADYFTALRACWAALWSTRALRYMASHGLDPADTAMAAIVQPLVRARAAGGGLSRTAEGEMSLSAVAGLGASLAQGEVVPDRIVLSRAGDLLEIEPGRKEHREDCAHGHGAIGNRVPGEAGRPSIDEREAVELGRLMLEAERVMGFPVEIEWALDEVGFKLLQARPLHVAESTAPDEIWLKHPRLNGHPAGVGWGTGTARVVTCECEIGRVNAGDILVTRVAGPALAHILPLVGGVVAELGGSTSHLASLARERGIPMVLGVNAATRRIPEGARVAVDGVAGIVRWMR